MTAPSRTNQQLIEEISVLKQRIKELEQSEAEMKRAEEENGRNQDIAERLAGEMAVIAEIGRVVSSTLDIKQVYERFDIEARKLIPYDRLLVNMKKTPDGHFMAVYISGMDNPGGELFPSPGTATGVVMHTRNGILIQPADAEEIKDLYPNLYDTFKMGLRSTMSIPLVYMDDVVGSLNFRSEKLKAFTEKDLRLAEKIGLQVAGVIANAQLFFDLQQTNKTLRESEEKFRLLIENAPDAIFIHADTRIVYLNRAAVKLFGAETADQLIGSPIMDRYAPEDHWVIEKRFQDVYEERKAFPITEQIYLRVDGSSVPVEAHGIPINYNDNNAALTFVRDITKRKKAEAAYRNSERLFKNAFSMSPAMMSIYRLSDGMFLEINEMFANYTGYQREEIIGHKVGELGILDSATLQRLRKIRLEDNLINNEEIQYKTKTGELRYGLYSAIPIEDDEGKKILSLLYDVTKRKRAEELLKIREEESSRLAKDLEEANIALRVVLSRREEDQKILEEKIQFNVNEIILPFIRSLNSAHLENRDKQYIGLLESNLKSILSPFMRNMSNTYKCLTPKETQIAEMIRQGKNSKDIADMLCTSIATINTHRNNIRKKLNMKNQKTNLRSHLLSLS